MTYFNQEAHYSKLCTNFFSILPDVYGELTLKVWFQWNKKQEIYLKQIKVRTMFKLPD
jgi:hypothetical protein